MSDSSSFVIALHPIYFIISIYFFTNSNLATPCRAYIFQPYISLTCFLLLWQTSTVSSITRRGKPHHILASSPLHQFILRSHLRYFGLPLCQVSSYVLPDGVSDRFDFYMYTIRGVHTTYIVIPRKLISTHFVLDYVDRCRLEQIAANNSKEGFYKKRGGSSPVYF